jgi:2-polyprenyl-3-methyl-5-hydroxy-6-metoxy-1,4-benzoquinol methylase
MAKDPWYIERIEPMHVAITHGHLREHLARYQFCGGRLSGRLLDAGCGTGYGTHLLGTDKAVNQVLGIDRNRRAINHADRYYSGPQIAFQQIDLLSQSLESLGRFDSITCLEVLEHVPEPEKLLSRLHGLLSPGGTLIVSTPLGAGRHEGTNQPFHYFQLKPEEFRVMLSPLFTFTMYGQKKTTIERWNDSAQYFLMLAVCQSRFDETTGEV